jgi:hypothetical protein
VKGKGRSRPAVGGGQSRQSSSTVTTTNRFGGMDVDDDVEEEVEEPSTPSFDQVAIDGMTREQKDLVGRAVSSSLDEYLNTLDLDTTVDYFKDEKLASFKYEVSYLLLLKIIDESETDARKLSAVVVEILKRDVLSKAHFAEGFEPFFPTEVVG